MTKKIVFYNTLKYIFFFLLFFVLSFAKVGEMRPFAFGMLFALVWCNQKIYLIAPMFVLSSLIVDFSLESFVVSSSCVFVFSLFFFLHYKFRKPLNKILIGLYAFLSQSVFLYINSYSLNSFLDAIAYLVVGMVFLYAYLFFMQSLLLRGIRRKYSLDEIVSGGVLLIAIGAGISNLPDFHGIISKGIFVFLVLIFVYLLNTSSGISFSVLLGLGSLVSNFDQRMFLLITLFALVSNLTKNVNRIFYGIAVLIIDVFVNYYFFNSYDIFMLFGTLSGIVLFLIIGKKTMEKLKTSIIGENEEFSLRYLIDRNNMSLSKKLFETSNLFLSMQEVCFSMSKTKMSPNQAIDRLVNELQKKVCLNCKNKERCKKDKNFLSDLKKFVELGLSKGIVSIFDLPNNLHLNCEKNFVLIQTVNDFVKAYNNFCVLENELSSSRFLLADQFFGISQILKSMSLKLNSKTSFNIELEQRLFEEFSFNHILCSEVLLTFEDKNISELVLVIRDKDLDYEKIEKIVCNTLKLKMDIKSVQNSEKPGFSIVVFGPKIFFDVIFGSVAALKHGSKTSGDSYSVLRVCEDKIMMALCDGMGSGIEAEKISSLCLELLEKFYRSGFETKLILDNLNKLLEMREEENFGALDICTFDLKNCSCDLLKLGAPIGFLKQKDQTRVIEAGSLPLGILKNVKPTSQSFALNDGDMIILITDGVLESFQSIEDLKTEINNFHSKNPQELAEHVLQKSLDRCQNFAQDDMSVLVGKIWRKI